MIGQMMASVNNGEIDGAAKHMRVMVKNSKYVVAKLKFFLRSYITSQVHLHH